MFWCELRFVYWIGKVNVCVKCGIDVLLGVVVIVREEERIGFCNGGGLERTF